MNLNGIHPYCGIKHYYVHYFFSPVCKQYFFICVTCARVMSSIEIYLNYSDFLWLSFCLLDAISSLQFEDV